MNLLLFGAGGQLGQGLLALAREKNIRTAGLTRAETDIADPGQVADAIDRARPDVVVNAAAYTAVDRAEAEPAQAARANALAPEVVARACASAGAALIHVSTDYVFDGRKRGAYLEDDAVRPLGAYGRSKAEGEARVRTAMERHVILRTAWLYGVHGRNFAKTILRQAQEQDELAVVDDQTGSPTGSADLAAAVLRVAEEIAAGRPVWGTYHFAGTGSASWHAFAEEIVAQQARLTGRRPRVRAVSTREFPTACPRPANSALDSAKFAARFGLRALPWRERTAEVVARLATAPLRAVTP